MTSKFDPHCVLFQPAVMQPLADFLFKPTDFTSLDDHAARSAGLANSDHVVAEAIPISGSVERAADPGSAGPHLWSPRMGPDARWAARALGRGGDEIQRLAEEASFSFTRLDPKLRKAMIDGFELIDDFVRVGFPSRIVVPALRAAVSRPPQSDRPHQWTQPAARTGYSLLERLKAAMIDEDLEGSLCVNNHLGVHLGVYNRGNARRAVSKDKYPPSPLPWSEHTRFETASVSKMTTALMFLQFVQAGFVGLDDSITHELPPFMNFESHYRKYHGNPDVTYRHLVQHRTGWPHDGGDNQPFYYYTALDFALFFSYTKEISGKITPRPTVSELAYANANFSILRLLIPMLPFNQAGKDGEKQKLWNTFTGKGTPYTQLTEYNWWCSLAFVKLSACVHSAAGMGPVVTVPNYDKDAAGYDDDDNENRHPEGFILGDRTSLVGASGLRYSSWELGRLYSALRTGKILNPQMLFAMFHPNDTDPYGGRLGWEKRKWTMFGYAWAHSGIGYGSRNLVVFLPDGHTVALMTNRGKPNRWNTWVLFDMVVQHWQAWRWANPWF